MDKNNLKSSVSDLEDWVAEAIKKAISESQKYAADQMKPFMGALGDLGKMGL